MRFKSRGYNLVLGLLILTALSCSGERPAETADIPKTPTFVQLELEPSYLEVIDDLRDYNDIPDEFFKGYDYKFSTRKYLKSVNSQLAEVKVDGVPAYEIIWRACEKYDINQRYLLAVLQREQSLVLCRFDEMDLWHRLDRACGWGVSDGGEHEDRFYGFKRQVNGCLRLSKRLFKTFKKEIPKYIIVEETRTRNRWGKYPTYKERVNLACRVIKPKSAVSAMLIIYTPYYTTTEGTVKIWRRLFPLSKNP